MDISVLAEQRRESVINLLKGMKIKKSDGEGFDRDDVYVCMQQLCDVYEKSIDDLTTGYEAQIAELQDKYQKYDENNDLYISLIMEAKKSSNEIISKAKNEVDEILASGKEEIARQEEELALARENAEQQKALLAAEIEQAAADAEAAKATLAEELAGERAKAENTKQKYQHQIAAMDQEFEEIKTNILRTAGKIDGLKSQIHEKDLTTIWNVQETPAAVNVPEPDIVVEETVVETPAAEFAAPAFDFSFTAEPEAAPEPVAVEEPAPVEPVIPVEPAPVEQAEEELTFEDLVAKLQKEEFGEPEAAPEAPVPEVEIPAVPEVEVPAEPKEALADVADLAVEEFTIELPGEEPAVEAAEEAAEDEISFEGLEELFKE